MDGLALLERARREGLWVWTEGERLVIEGPRRAEALALALLDRKAEVLPLLSTAKPPTVNAPPEWHAHTVARRVEAEGVCIFWSEALQDLVAFVKGDADLDLVPAGIVAFTDVELRKLFPEGEPGPDPYVLRMLYQAKRLAGAKVVDVDPTDWPQP